MPDFQHDNPYASPRGAAEPADMTALDVHGIWRDGDELVMLAARVKPPKACWVTNRTGLVLETPIVCDSPAVTIALLLLHVPVAGIVLSIVAAFILQARGRVPSFPILGFLTWWRWCIRIGIAVLVSLSLMAALMVSITALSVRIPWLSLLIIPAALAQVAVYYYRDRFLLGLAGRPAGRDPGGKGVVRIRGVHPGYLDRLPALPQAEIAANASGHDATSRADFD